MPVKRKAHELTKTTGTELPSRLIVVSTVSERELLSNGQIRYTLQTGYAAHYRTRRDNSFRFQSETSFQDSDSFWRWVDSVCPSKSKTYLLCIHLDQLVAILDCFTIMQSLEWELNSWFAGGSTNIVEFKKNKTKLVCLDSRNFFNDELDILAQEMDLMTDVESSNDNDDQLLGETVRQNVSILFALWQHWISFLSDNDLGSFRHTLASTAFNAFRYRFYDETVFMHDNTGSLLLERESYRGGYTRCFYVGKKNNDEFYLLDVNSMYGKVMYDNEYPVSFVHYAKGANLDTLARLLDRYCVVATVDIETDEPIFPLKATRGYAEQLLREGKINEAVYEILNNRITYPVGRFTTTLTTPELTYLLHRKAIHRIYDICVHTKACLFTNYVDHFHQARTRYKQSGNVAFAKIAKLFTNTLYGKFGQRDLSQQRIGDCAPDAIMSVQDYNLDTGVYSELIYLGGGIYRVSHTGDSYNSYCAIAAHVTAYGRLYLYNLKNQLPHQSCYYMDTDSLLVDQRGFDVLRQFVIPDQLGGLKIEAQSNWIQINAPKDYAMEGHVRVKGISKNAIEINNGKFITEDREGLRGMILRGRGTGSYGHTRTKTLKRQIYGGIVRPDGWIDPIVIG